MDTFLFFLGLYLSWYFLTRIIFRMALVYFYRVPFNKALDIFDPRIEHDAVEVGLFYAPVSGELYTIFFAYCIFIDHLMPSLAKLPIPTPAKMDRALIRFAERRQLRLKNSDKVGLLTEVKR